MPPLPRLVPHRAAAIAAVRMSPCGTSQCAFGMVEGGYDPERHRSPGLRGRVGVFPEDEIGEV